ncbi:LTA synthase family protein [Billgrantia pellis]|uniref:LTA synthase family protein n=2 Tax=Billgrantia pellis TaxID=2606936 RepID=A0A7V7G6G0_9GAMM|nr:LTA synthase family protein [Halomonas pellis]
MNVPMPVKTTTQTTVPSLFRTWLLFSTLLALVTWGIRLLSADMMVPEGLWQRAWWWGLRFDLAVAALLAGLTVLVMWPFARLLPTLPRKGWLMPALAILLSAHLGDWLYWQETGRHLGYEAGELLNSAGSLLNMLVLHWPWVLGIVFLLCLAYQFPWWPSRSERRGWRLELNVIAVVAATVLLVRGSINGLPQGPDDALRLGNSSEATAALNGAYAALYGLQSSSKNTIEPIALEWMDDSEAQQRVRALYRQRLSNQPSRVQDTVSPVNVVFVMLESWSSYHSQAEANGQPITPHFDALAERSLSTYRMVSSGLRTSEGMFGLFCSYQNPLGRSVAETRLAMNDYRCLPEILRDHGWQTAFFQGSHENTSGVGSFAQSLGFSASYGKADIVTRDYAENAWGVYDHDLYRFVLETIDQLQEPFFAGINTNSTHATELRPDFPPLLAGSDRHSAMRNVMRLADHELGEFVTALEQREWEHPWMLVLVSDHTTRVASTPLDRFLLPFLIHAPVRVSPAKPERIAHHRDVAPTVADILGLTMPNAMGHSLLDPTAPQLAEFYHAGNLTWFSGNDRLVEIPLSAPDRMRCATWPDQALALDLLYSPCQPSDSDKARDAYALTKTAQRHLFEGRGLSIVQ